MRTVHLRAQPPWLCGGHAALDNGNAPMTNTMAEGSPANAKRPVPAFGRAGILAAGLLLLAPAAARASSIALCSLAPCTASIAIGASGTVAENMGTGATSASTAFTSAHANFGDLGLSDSEIEFPATEAQWLDSFTVNGSTGPGTMIVDWSLTGTLNLDGFGTPCTFPFADVNLTDLGGFGSSSVGGASLDRCAGPLSEPVNLSGSISVPFTYGTSFSGGFDLKGNANLGSFNFLDTASVTNIVLPAGATLTTGSDTVYPTSTAAVPEPASPALIGTGIGLLAGRRFRKSARAR
jgi:hypothetical protein